MAEAAFFSKELFLFLEELKKNNTKRWFEENRERYVRHIKEPMLAFISAMGDRLESISPSFIADTRVNGGSMFRIYRDVRFSKNKAPYKENVGCQFRHSVGKGAHAPGFYIHLQPGNCFVGGGIWQPPTPDLTKIREAILAKPEEWGGVKKFLDRSELASFIEGESLKRPPRGFSEEDHFIKDIKQKTFFAGSSIKDAVVASPGFIDQVENVFLDTLPLMRFITLSLGLSFA